MKPFCILTTNVTTFQGQTEKERKKERDVEAKRKSNRQIEGHRGDEVRQTHQGQKSVSLVKIRSGGLLWTPDMMNPQPSNTPHSGQIWLIGLEFCVFDPCFVPNVFPERRPGRQPCMWQEALMEQCLYSASEMFTSTSSWQKASSLGAGSVSF